MTEDLNKAANQTQKSDPASSKAMQQAAQQAQQQQFRQISSNPPQQRSRNQQAQRSRKQKQRIGPPDDAHTCAKPSAPSWSNWPRKLAKLQELIANLIRLRPSTTFNNSGIQDTDPPRS